MARGNGGTGLGGHGESGGKWAHHINVNNKIKRFRLLKGIYIQIFLVQITEGSPGLNKISKPRGWSLVPAASPSGSGAATTTVEHLRGLIHL